MVDYTDQSPISVDFEDRNFSSTYTEYGIKAIESNFITRILNFNKKIISIQRIENKPKIYVDKFGKQSESFHYNKTLTEIPIDEWLKERWGYEVKITWADEEGSKKEYEFTQGDERPYPNKETMKEDYETIAQDIKNCVHLHSFIKENLLDNLKNFNGK